MTDYLLFTIDVEDWFQVENFKQYIPFSSWSSYELRVEKNTNRLLDLFDSAGFKFQISNFKISATFFVLGWLAEKLPSLVREIHSRGHEVASHGYYHNLCSESSTKDLRADLRKSKKLLEDIIGAPVFGYRAPSFSINHTILQIIHECGYQYDSSYNSFAMHGRYGHINITKGEKKGIALPIYKGQNHKLGTLNHEPSTLYELPISNLRFPHQVFPWGGGGYFRLIPFPIFSLGVKSILKKENAYLFYMHPWEIDPNQPRVHEAPAFYKFRHYIHLDKTYSKLLRFLEDFNQYTFISCQQYLEEKKSA